MPKLIVIRNTLITIKLLLIFLSIPWTEGANVTLLKQDVPQQFDFIPLRYGDRAANIYEDYPLEAAGKDYTMIGLLTRFIYSYTLGPVVNAVSGFYSTFMSPVVDPLLSSMSLLLLPITLPLKPVMWMIKGVMASMSPMYHSTLQATGFEPKPDDKMMAHPRRRRGIMDTTTRMATDIMDLPMNAIALPFQILRMVFDVLFTPFGFMYNVISAPYHLMFGSNQSNIQKLNKNSNSSLGTATINEYFSRMINKMVDNMSDSAKRAMISLLFKFWEFSKQTLLPELDKLLQKSANSKFLSNDVKSFISTFHSSYQMLHLLGMI